MTFKFKRDLADKTGAVTTVEILIDIDGPRGILAIMGRKALLSAKGKSVDVGGAIVVRKAPVKRRA